MGRPSNPPLFQPIKHTTDEVVNRVQDNVKKLAGAVSETLEEYATTAELDTAIAAAVAALPGSVIALRVLTNGTVSYTPTAGTRDIILEEWGGGGGGGGAVATGAGQVSAGGGGGAGGYLRKVIKGIGAGPFTVAIGAGGTGVNGAAGNNGGNTTFNDETTTYTAFGGVAGGVGGLAGAFALLAQGGTRNTTSTNGDVNGTGTHGGHAFALSSSATLSGEGGHTSLGGGGQRNGGTTAGGNGVANTGGGGGGASAGNSSAAQTGGTGGTGLMLITELS